MSAPRYEGDLPAQNFADAYLRAGYLTEAERAAWYSVHLAVSGPVSAAVCCGIAARQREVELRARALAKGQALGVGSGVRIRRLNCGPRRALKARK